MTKTTLKQYNVILCDFDWFISKIETELINALFDCKLLDDKEFSNNDTKKTIQYFIIKKIITFLCTEKEKCVFLIKPEIFHTTSELLTFFNNTKLRREMMKLFNFLIKNRYNVFVFLNKSYSEDEENDFLEIPEIRDFVDLHIEKTTKKIFIDSDTPHKLFNKLCKKYK